MGLRRSLKKESEASEGGDVVRCLLRAEGGDVSTLLLGAEGGAYRGDVEKVVTSIICTTIKTRTNSVNIDLHEYMKPQSCMMSQAVPRFHRGSKEVN